MSGLVGEEPKVASLLRLLARPPLDGPAPRIAYDTGRQVSRVWEKDRWVDSWEAETLSGTKKFDVETGEDAKGR